MISLICKKIIIIFRGKRSAQTAFLAYIHLMWRNSPDRSCFILVYITLIESIALYLSIVFHYVFQIAPRGDRRIYLVVISYYTALVSPCGIHYRHTCSLRLELSGCWFAVALSLRRRTPAPTQKKYIFNKHKHINIPSYYIIYYIISQEKFSQTSEILPIGAKCLVNQ